MKRIRLIIINRSKYVLKVSYKNCGREITEQISVKKRSKLLLDRGRYNICFYYENANIELSSNYDGFLDVGDIPSPENNVFIGKMLVLNYLEKTVKIQCKEKISIAALIAQN